MVLKGRSTDLNPNCVSPLNDLTLCVKEPRRIRLKRGHIFATQGKWTDTRSTWFLPSCASWPPSARLLSNHRDRPYHPVARHVVPVEVSLYLNLRERLFASCGPASQWVAGTPQAAGPEIVSFGNIDTSTGVTLRKMRVCIRAYDE